MKQSINCVLIFLVICTLMLFAIKVEAEERHNSFMLSDLLQDTNSDLICEILDSSKFTSSMDGVEIEGQPLLVTYTANYFAYTSMPFDEALDKIHNSCNAGIVILQESPIFLCEYERKSKVGVFPNVSVIPTYVQDIINGQITQSFMGEVCQIENVVCFDASTSFQGITVIFDTDKGKFVRYYEDELSSANEFSWDSFIEYGSTYFAYISSDKVNYDEFGNPLGGANISFLEFIENQSLYQNDQEVHCIDAQRTVTYVFGLMIICGVFFVLKPKHKGKNASFPPSSS